MNNEVVLITGGSGFVGSGIVARLEPRYRVVVLDRHPPEGAAPGVEFEKIDLTAKDSLDEALARVAGRHGPRIASVIHLAAFFDETGKPNPKYREITVEGTRRLLDALEPYEVDQFVFASTMLVHRAGQPGETVDETTPLDPKFPYRASKVETERLIHERHGERKVVNLRPAGIYDDGGHNPFLAHQIARIYERRLEGRVYPGDLATGQSFLHRDDLAEAVARLVERRAALPPELPLLLGEPDVMPFGELQEEIGRLVHGDAWQTWQVPKPLAKAGSWVQAEILDDDPFIRPYMVEMADDHYRLDIGRARDLLGWEPRHRLRDMLPAMIAGLKADPPAWYRANRLNAHAVAGTAPKEEGDQGGMDHEHHQQHMAKMEAMASRLMWCHFTVIGLGAWLLTSPFQFGLFDPAGFQPVRDVTAERGLWDVATRAALNGWSDVLAGLLLMTFGAMSLTRRFAWAPWGTTGVGLWLLFAPLLVWSPSGAAYANDMIVGAFAIALSVLVPMMPGMSHEGMMDENDVPPGWSYSPSSWVQRLPIIALGFFGFLIARQLAAYQLGYTDHIVEPFFAGVGGRNGSEHIVTSDVSRAWPIADGGLGASSYLIEALMGAMGSSKRWRTMPWMVTFFFILVVPLGGVSIFFIVIQPIMIGTYCTLCLVAAAAMLAMIPLTLDEVVAMTQYMLRSRRAGRPFWRTFFQGGPDIGGAVEKGVGFDRPLGRQALDSVRGVTLPWTLAASCAVGAWLMFSRLVFGAEGLLADSDHLVGAMIITVAVCAMAEVVRPLRFLNLVLGAWLVAVPWLLDGVGAAAAANEVACGLLVIGLSLPRGRRSDAHYGAADRWVF
ncbi:NAD-dependent epimerase/dehydratase family protein [Geminicoccus roseus]|uniref:NAD-dependent epimerase/dehydratase family protein n=1 Tax=Geminicoccus roseus TaxID=404900 RepID=UPI00041D82EF|nr:NAD-dependent epimerase/dehydratase family protein [Geminicoccus roseus]